MTELGKEEGCMALYRPSLKAAGICNALVSSVCHNTSAGVNQVLIEADIFNEPPLIIID